MPGGQYRPLSASKRLCNDFVHIINYPGEIIEIIHILFHFVVQQTMSYGGIFIIPFV